MDILCPIFLVFFNAPLSNKDSYQFLFTDAFTLISCILQMMTVYETAKDGRSNDMVIRFYAYYGRISCSETVLGMCQKVRDGWRKTN